MTTLFASTLKDVYRSINMFEKKQKYFLQKITVVSLQCNEI